MEATRRSRLHDLAGGLASFGVSSRVGRVMEVLKYLVNELDYVNIHVLSLTDFVSKISWMVLSNTIPLKMIVLLMTRAVLIYFSLGRRQEF